MEYKKSTSIQYSILIGFYKYALNFIYLGDLERNEFMVLISHSQHSEREEKKTFFLDQHLHIRITLLFNYLGDLSFDGGGGWIDPFFSSFY